MALDILTLAAASGSDGGLGKIGTIPASGVLYVRAPSVQDAELLEWILACNKSCSYQLYHTQSIVQSITLTLASLGDTETLTFNGLTFTGETTEEDALASARKFLVGGTDAAAATALAALINDATYGVPGVVASAASAVVTCVPKPSNPAYLMQAATGTAAGHCAVASTTLAGLVRQGSSVSLEADTTTGGYTIEQWVNEWPFCYIGITNADAGAAATVSLKLARHRYRD
jgi:hypothetical protein